jgi:hypothetical protein
MYNTTAVPRSPLTALQGQVSLLRRTVARNTPQTSTWQDSTVSYTTAAATGIFSQDYSLTSRFISSGTPYTDAVLGDRYRNKSVMLKIDAGDNIPKVRLIVYWTKKTGNSMTINDFLTTPDPSAFTVISDTMFFPAGKQKSTVFKRFNLRGKITNYNQSSSVLEEGDLRFHIVLYSDTAVTKTIAWQQRLNIQNK